MHRVYFFLPNIIGYVRIALLAASIHGMFNEMPLFGIAFYMLSYLLDALDGITARTFNQCSKFGATLDMVTDRSSSVLLLAFLMHHPPRLLNDSLISSIYGPSTFALLIALDISSHYMHMTAMLASGSDSHKRIPRKHRNHHKILSLYYENQYVLFFFCLFNELFFVALYVAALPTHAWQAFTNMTAIGETGLRSLLFLSLPFSVIKQVISAVQLQNAADTLVASQDQLTSSKKGN